MSYTHLEKEFFYYNNAFRVNLLQLLSIFIKFVWLNINFKKHSAQSRFCSAECDPVVQRGVFGLKIGRNGTNYREPAFQSVVINAGSHIAADDVASKKARLPCD